MEVKPSIYPSQQNIFLNKKDLQGQLVPTDFLNKFDTTDVDYTLLDSSTLKSFSDELLKKRNEAPRLGSYFVTKVDKTN